MSEGQAEYTTPITLESVLEYFPELHEIRGDAVRLLSDDERDDYWDNYEEIKSAMNSCVGWKAKKGLPDFMYTSEAHDVARREIFKGLL